MSEFDRAASMRRPWPTAGCYAIIYIYHSIYIMCIYIYIYVPYCHMSRYQLFPQALRWSRNFRSCAAPRCIVVFTGTPSKDARYLKAAKNQSTIHLLVLPCSHLTRSIPSACPTQISYEFSFPYACYIPCNFRFPSLRCLRSVHKHLGM